jgi:hypothetical protein
MFYEGDDIPFASFSLVIILPANSAGKAEIAQKYLMEVFN